MNSFAHFQTLSAEHDNNNYVARNTIRPNNISSLSLHLLFPIYIDIYTYCCHRQQTSHRGTHTYDKRQICGNVRVSQNVAQIDTRDQQTHLSRLWPTHLGYNPNPDTSVCVFYFSVYFPYELMMAKRKEKIPCTNKNRWVWCFVPRSSEFIYIVAMQYVYIIQLDIKVWCEEIPAHANRHRPFDYPSL